MEGKWRKPVRRKGKVKMMHLVIRSPDGQQGHGGTFFERLADCNSPNSLTLILIEDPTQLSIVHVQPNIYCREICHSNVEIRLVFPFASDSDKQILRRQCCLLKYMFYPSFIIDNIQAFETHWFCPPARSPVLGEVGES